MIFNPSLPPVNAVHHPPTYPSELKSHTVLKSQVYLNGVPSGADKRQGSLPLFDKQA
jgi:hypothetical protein